MSIQGGSSKGRSLSVKTVLILVVVLVIIGLVAYVSKALEARRIAHDADQALANQAQRTAENLAQAIALFGTDEIADENWSLVQENADELVRAEDIQYVAVVDTTGRAVVHTDRSLRGQQFVRPETEDHSIDGQAPVVPLNRQIATVHVGISPPK